jgi:capsular exopolysaccharide synthesis family protein
MLAIRLVPTLCEEGVFMALSNRNPRPIAQTNPRSPITEAYRTVRTNVQFASVDGDVRAILVTSSLPSEGKTSTACNIAVVSAEAGKRVLLIDADMRKPQVHQRFQISNLYGLTSVLIKERSFEECVIESQTPGLMVLPSGPIPPNPYEMLASKAFSDFIQSCKETYDVVIVDSPPVLSVADALVISRSSDGVVFVVDAKKTNRAHAKKATLALQQVNAKILGVVLNRLEKKAAGGYYYYNYYSSGEPASV